MAFTNTHMRSASFGIVTSLPDDVIDSFWYIIDHFLKMSLNWKKNSSFNCSITMEKLPSIFQVNTSPQPLILTSTILLILFIHQEYLVLDMDGRETILLPEENDLF